MTKVIFLDIDGPMLPLRAHALERHPNSGHREFDPLAVSWLNRLLSMAPARLVISSTWRVEGRTRIEALLRFNGIDPALLHADWETTDPVSGVARSREIRRWLTRHPEATAWVAFDDDPVARMKGGGGVQCDFADGLRWKHICKAAQLLGIEQGALVRGRATVQR